MQCETCGHEFGEEGIQQMTLTDDHGHEELYVYCHRCALRAEAERQLLAVAVANELERRARQATSELQAAIMRRQGRLN